MRRVLQAVETAIPKHTRWMTQLAYQIYHEPIWYWLGKH